MSYATLEQLQAELGDHYARLTDREDAETADDGVGQALLDAADAEMHGHLAARYRVPISTAGRPALAALLATHALRIAAHAAWLKSLLRKREPETTRRLYNETLAWLASVRDGKLILPENPEAPPQTTGSFSAKAVGDERELGDFGW